MVSSSPWRGDNPINAWKVLHLRDGIIDAGAIRAAFHKRSLVDHPDRPGGDHNVYIRVRYAYDILQSISARTSMRAWLRACPQFKQTGDMAETTGPSTPSSGNPPSGDPSSSTPSSSSYSFAGGNLPGYRESFHRTPGSYSKSAKFKTNSIKLILTPQIDQSGTKPDRPSATYSSPNPGHGSHSKSTGFILSYNINFLNRPVRNQNQSPLRIRFVFDSRSRYFS